MEDYVSQLEGSFNLALEKVGANKLAESFFDKFFAAYPEISQYFAGTDIGYFKGKKLKIVFEFITDIVNHPDFAEVHIAQEVLRHQIYGLKDEAYYFVLIDSLELAVKEALGEKWNSDYQSAWHDIGLIFKAIIGKAVDELL
ncbi:hypothetical protein EDC56_0378 [Sinobacterium caligoides]|uniref:Globin domain-containing protein n=1 Tax=Sinobacterium caligoides TaxID=933926 RepID=A0A3N2DYV1_9GAMM|nr:globin domain-containing protein [Sinobacterium caligoides]ROS04862.1 hypothetical protein EDC56_0378 [Sinobacterium caligoides]